MVKKALAALLAVWVVATILVPYASAEQKKKVKYTGSHVAAVASTNVLSETYVPNDLVVAVQLTVAVAGADSTASFNQDGQALKLNSATALTDGNLYAFEFGVTPGASYTLTFGTNTTAYYTLTEVYR